jgi:uncharacterized protein (DUF1684 family)
MRSLFPLFPALLLIAACSGGTDKLSFAEEHRLWQEKRIERLKSETGWLNIAGLYWLREGENSFGSDSSNFIVFPEIAPARIGKYILDEGKIRFIPEKGSAVSYAMEPAVEMDIATDRSGSPSILESGSLAWFIIQRGSRYGIRLRDYQNPALEEFKGIETFTPDPEWQLRAEFEAFEETREILVPTVTGTEEKYMCPGILRFRIGDRVVELQPLESGKRFFIIFADETSGLETYGGGRFLYTEKPDRKGRLLIDFNRAYNPPCAFTPYATCPLPPAENILPLRIEAGEKFTGH